MIQTLARQTGTTDRGNWFCLSQNAPHIIQLTLQNDGYAISETLENIRSEAEMIQRRNVLEDEFIAWVTSKHQPRENNNEATEQVL